MDGAPPPSDAGARLCQGARVLAIVIDKSPADLSNAWQPFVCLRFFVLHTHTTTSTPPQPLAITISNQLSHGQQTQHLPWSCLAFLALERHRPNEFQQHDLQCALHSAHAAVRPLLHTPVAHRQQSLSHQSRRECANLLQPGSNGKQPILIVMAILQRKQTSMSLSDVAAAMTARCARTVESSCPRTASRETRSSSQWARVR